MVGRGEAFARRASPTHTRHRSSTASPSFSFSSWTLASAKWRRTSDGLVELRSSLVCRELRQAAIVSLRAPELGLPILRHWQRGQGTTAEATSVNLAQLSYISQMALQDSTRFPTILCLQSTSGNVVHGLKETTLQREFPKCTATNGIPPPEPRHSPHRQSTNGKQRPSQFRLLPLMSGVLP